MPIKIIDLTAETNPSNDDLLIIRDNITGTTRKITRTALFIDPPIPNGAITHEMLGLGIIEKENLGDSAKIEVRTRVQSSPGTLTANVDDYEIEAVSNLNSSMNIANPTGSPVNGQGVMYRIKDNGTARAISYGSQFRAIGVSLPTATVANKTLYINARWNAESATWDVLAIGRQG